MTEQDVRSVLVEALALASVYAFRALDIGPQFVAGEADVRLDALEMDSLARMELCIGIEANTGVSLLSEDLDRFVMLSDLARAVQQELP